MSGGARERLAPAAWAALYGLALLACLAVYAPSLSGPFLSDDVYYLQGNRPVREPSLANLAEILEPRSDLTLMVANYAPVHLLVHAAEWQLFGERFLGYHLTNLALHAANALLLAALFLRAGVRREAALLGAAFFLLHPANVEAVAWISQVKTLAAMALMLAALLIFERRVATGALAFALSLGSKATTAVALPVAAAWEWIRGARPERPRARASLVLWSGILVLFAGVQFVAFRQAHLAVLPVSESRLVQLWTSAAIGARYLWMAATSLGLSTFHEPEPVASPLDPWVVAAFAAAAALGARSVWTLWRRREEGAFWLWAGVSFGPVAQLFPFLYPMADRYLYFILPGLVGGSLLLGGELAERWLPPARRRSAARAAAAAALLLLAVFALRSHERAGLWVSEARIFADAVRHYPHGAGASFARAREAAAQGDVDAAVELLRRATARGHRDFEDLLSVPELAALRGRPAFDAFLRERARLRIQRLAEAPRLHVSNRLALARAFLLRRGAGPGRGGAARGGGKRRPLGGGGAQAPPGGGRRRGRAAAGERRRHAAVTGDRLACAFLGLALGFGTLFLLLTPPLQAPDEGRHLLRAFAISEGTLLAESLPGQVAGVDVPRSLVDLERELSPGLRRKTGLRQDPARLEAALAERLAPDDRVRIALPSLYSPLAYLPQALGIGLGRALGAAPVALVWLGRAANLLFYALAVAAALRLAPAHRVVFALLALTPMALFEAASLAADGAANALAFLFAAAVLRAADTGRPTLVARQIAGLALLASALALTKQAYAPLAAAALAIPAPRFASRRERALGLAAIVGCAALAAGLWFLALRGLTLQPLTFVADPGAQLRFLAAHPLAALAVPLRSALLRGGSWLLTFVGVLGSLDVRLPGAVYLLHPLVLLAAALLDGGPASPLRGARRLWLLAVAAGTGLFVLLLGYVAWTPPGDSLVRHVQGRYFLPLAPFVAAAIHLPRAAAAPRALRLAGLGWSALLLAIAAVALALRYWGPPG